MIYEYQQIIDDLNTGKISAIRFFIKNYTHYKNCIIERKIDIIPNGKSIVLISVKLTEDRTEDVSFLKTFKEDEKLFKMGKKGTFTLKEAWKFVDIIQIQ